MIVLGLTGSIGMGKSTIGSMMTTLGIPVHESDHVVRDLLKADSEARPALAAAFPYFEFPDIYEKKTKDFDRKALGALVFNNDILREKLEATLHPFVQKAQQDFIQAHTRKGIQIACLDIPLLFETGAEKRVNYTITVSAPLQIQRQRVLARPNMNEKKFEAILNRQMPDSEKCTRSDYVIHTGLGRAHSMKMLKTAIQDIKNLSGLEPRDAESDEPV